VHFEDVHPGHADHDGRADHRRERRRGMTRADVRDFAQQVHLARAERRGRRRRRWEANRVSVHDSTRFTASSTRVATNGLTTNSRAPAWMALTTSDCWPMAEHIRTRA